MEELKPCPLCGKPLIVRKSIAGGEEHYIAYCHCGFEFADDCNLKDFIKECNRRAAPENKPLTLRELGELAEADETVYETSGRAWDLYSAPPEIRAKSEHCNIVVDADKIASGFFLYARRPEESEP